MFPPNNSSIGGGSYYSTGITYSSGTALHPIAVLNPPPLIGVMESPAVKLDDRGWLDAQIDEVCALAG